jgi:hypothetical protein
MAELEGNYVQIYDVDVSMDDEGQYIVDDITKGDIFEISKNFRNQDIFEILKENGYIKSYVNMGDLSFVDNDEVIEIFDEVTGALLWQIWEVSTKEVMFHCKNGTTVYNSSGDRMYFDENGEVQFGKV